MTGPLDAARRLVDAGGRGTLVTALSGPDAGSSCLLGPSGETIEGAEPSPAAVAAAGRVLERGVPEVVEDDADGSWFVEPVQPPPRVVVFGAIAVADALVPMAAAAGYSVVVVDPRPWLATADRYPDADEVHCGEPSEVVDRIDIDAATAVVSFLHEPRHEDPVLRAALASPAWYVGAMGSRRSTAAKRERLADAGVSDEQLDRLHAPIGLDIGAVPPREIAVAVLAELVAVSRGAV